MPSEQQASYDWRVRALDGTSISMESKRGETLFLNIWSTMCAPCVAEIPSIERLQKQVGGDGIAVMCVATDGDLDRVRNFVAAQGWKLPVHVLEGDEIPHAFDSDYIPATYIVSPNGLIVCQHVGAALWDHPRVVTFLRGLAVQSAIGPG